MIKEIRKGIYDALCEAMGREDVPLMASDTEEPKERPGIKIYLVPKAAAVTGMLRLTEYEIMILFYATDRDDYYIEHMAVEEALCELVNIPVETSEGIFIELDEMDIENDTDMLIAYTGCTLDTYVGSREDGEIMEELDGKLTNHSSGKMGKLYFRSE